MSENWMTAATIGVIAAMTWATRALPYLLFAKRRPPRTVAYLGAVLPASIMVILVVYCLRNTQFAAYPYGAAEVLSVLLVGIMQLWRKNTLLSVFMGTLCYMALIHTVSPV